MGSGTVSVYTTVRDIYVVLVHEAVSITPPNKISPGIFVCGVELGFKVYALVDSTPGRSTPLKKLYFKHHFFFPALRTSGVVIRVSSPPGTTCLYFYRSGFSVATLVTTVSTARRCTQVCLLTLYHTRYSGKVFSAMINKKRHI